MGRGASRAGALPGRSCPRASQVRLASGGDDGAIRLWAPSKNGPSAGSRKSGCAQRPSGGAPPGHGREASVPRFRRRGPLLSGCGIRQLSSSQSAKSSTRTTAGSVLSPKCPADGATWLASGGEDGTIRLWQVADDGQLLPACTTSACSDSGTAWQRPTCWTASAIVDELHELLSPNVTEAPSGTSGPQVVMIQGPWGTGKSSVMHDLRIVLDEPSPTSSFAQTTSWVVAGQRWRRWRRELSPFQARRLMRAPPRLDSVKPGPPGTPSPPGSTPGPTSPRSRYGPDLPGASSTPPGTSSAQASEASGLLAEPQRPASRLCCSAAHIHQRIWRPTLAAFVALLVPLTVALINGRADLLTQLPKSASGWVLIPVGAVFVACTVCRVAVLLRTGNQLSPAGHPRRPRPADILDQRSGEKLPSEICPISPPPALLYRAKKDVHNLVKDLERPRIPGSRLHR